MLRWAPSLLALLLVIGSAHSLEPKEIIVIYNKNVPDSKSAALHYQKKRTIPLENLIALDLPTTDDIKRDEYQAKMVKPLREKLKERKGKIRCLLTMYGVPLRVGVQPPTADEQKKIDKLKPDLEAANKKFQELEKANPRDEKTYNQAKSEKQNFQFQYDALAHSESYAAVDSELMLLWHEKYALDRWVSNPLYWKNAARPAGKEQPITLMTCRLDGPTLQVVKRMIDDAVFVESNGGLKGIAYFDARGLGKGQEPKNMRFNTGYEGYDQSFRDAAALLKNSGMETVLDDKEELFAVGACPDTALYGGWYALTNYRACCKFKRGAVAWHLASGEAATLHDLKGKCWCPHQLNDGACATLGPVGEPYTIAFPKADEFFGFLACGKYTLVESYSRSITITSWMLVLVGDPLYRPYAKNPKVDEKHVGDGSKY